MKIKHKRHIRRHIQPDFPITLIWFEKVVHLQVHYTQIREETVNDKAELSRQILDAETSPTFMYWVSNMETIYGLLDDED